MQNEGMASAWGKKQKLITNFAQGSQRIARITELAGPNEFVIEPERVESLADPQSDAPDAQSDAITDAEIASLRAGDGDAPIAASPAKRAASAYTQKIPVLGKTIVVA